MEASGEHLPLGMQVPAGAHGTEIEIPPEPPEVGARALYVASRLLAGATTFFFLAFLFAYFYLRSLNQNGAWNAHHVKPEQGFGLAIALCIVISAALAIAAGRRGKSEANWVPLVSGALVLGLAAVVLQCIEYTIQKFGPTDGAYASVYVGWTALFMVAVLGTLYWLETLLATELRARRAPPVEPHSDIAEPHRLTAPGLDAAVFYWCYLVAIGVIAYVTLYLI